MLFNVNPRSAPSAHDLVAVPCSASCRVKSDLDFILREVCCRYGNTAPEFQTDFHAKQTAAPTRERARVRLWGYGAIAGSFDGAMLSDLRDPMGVRPDATPPGRGMSSGIALA